MILWKFLVILTVSFICLASPDTFNLLNRVRNIHNQLISQNRQLEGISQTLTRSVKHQKQVKAPVYLSNLTAEIVYSSRVSGSVSKPNGQPLTTLVDSKSDLHLLDGLLLGKDGLTQKIRSLLNDIVKKSSNINLSSSSSFVGNISISSLATDEVVVNTTSLYPSLDDLVTSDQPNVFISGHKTFRRPVNATSVRCEKFNGYNLKENVVLAGQTSPIKVLGPLRFSSIVVQSDVQSKYGVRGLNMSNLVPLKGGDVVLHSDMKFENNLIVTKSLNARFINGQNWSDIQKRVLTTDSNQLIDTLIVTRNVRVPKVEQLATINNASFTRALRSMLTKQDNVYFKGTLIINKSRCHIGNLNAGKVNGYSLMQDFLTTNTQQEIPVGKTFAKINVNDLSIKERLNNLPFPASYVTLTGRERIESPVEIVDRIRVDGDMNAPELVARGTTSRGQPFLRTIRRNLVNRNNERNFKGTIYVNGPLKVTGRINGVHLRSLLVDSVHKLEKNAVVSGVKTIQHPADIGNCEFGNINRVPIGAFVNLAKPEGETIYSRIELSGPVKVGQLIRFKAGLRGDFFGDLVDRRISLYHRGYIDKWIYFESVEVENLHVNGMINGVQPGSLVFKNGLENITAKKIFSQGARFHSISANNFNTAKLNGRGLKQCYGLAKKY